ncbi:MAG: hydantoinase/oxoprolinase family protein [Pseudomonadota bacterium]
MAWRVGIDIGGTFTDFAALNERTGRLVVHKQLTTPHDPSKAVISGLPTLLDKAAIEPSDVDTIIHGTTLVTNALIERRGAKTAMICTEGFADVLDIAKERRYDMYDLAITYPEPLIERAMRIEIDERMTASGAVSTAPDPDQVRRRLAEKTEQNGPIQSVAVCLLNSYVNDSHEREVADIVQSALPDAYVSTSADIFPFMREYERWTTTTMNAFTQPMLCRYLDRLEDGLAELGFAGSLFIMTSSGGTVTLETARRYPVRLLESGPAAGVHFAARLGETANIADLLAFDMGGTTAKGALVRDMEPLHRYEMEVARVHEFRLGSGLPAKIPVIDLIEIGAGGGSLAEVDARGVVKVGPRSAGADPGPVCYSLGGTRPALTDANLTLGYLSPDFFLGGEMSLDANGAASAIGQDIADPLNVDTLRAAWGIHETINEDVARAFRNHASERGFDYRRSSMVAFGGSGPIHALRVARKLLVPRVVFPSGAGVASALGMLISPLSFEVLRSDLVEVETLAPDDLDAKFADLVDEATEAFAGTGLTSDDLSVTRALDMRYRGQGYDIEVALPQSLDGKALIEKLPSLFAADYENVFAKSFPERATEIVAWKVTVTGPRPSIDTDFSLDAGTGLPSLKGERMAFFPEVNDFQNTPVYDRQALRPGDSFAGPALVEERESTCVIGVGDKVEIDIHGNLVATIATKQQVLAA